MINTTRAEEMGMCRGIDESGREEKEREITQFGNMLIWFGLCITAAIPVWLVANAEPGPATFVIFPLPISYAALLLTDGESVCREILVAGGLAYFAILFSPILIQRPAAVRSVLRILAIAGLLHVLVIATGLGFCFCVVYCIGMLID